MRISIIFLLLLLVGCSQSILQTIPNDNEILSILKTDSDLQSFISKSNEIKITEKVFVTETKLEQLRQQPDGVGQWYRELPKSKYLRVIITNEQNNQFIAMIDRDTRKVVDILALITLSLS